MSSPDDINSNPDIPSTAKEDQEDNVREEKKYDNKDGILSKIADGVQQFAEALSAGERNVMTDSLKHPTSGRADLIATNRKALRIDEKLETEREMGRS
uniref:Uncharacterized protein n=1 Tax=Panagrolaimus superbus TaxID=310955 RepID=A0A914ZAB3_9BILA